MDRPSNCTPADEVPVVLEPIAHGSVGERGNANRRAVYSKLTRGDLWVLLSQLEWCGSDRPVEFYMPERNQGLPCPRVAVCPFCNGISVYEHARHCFERQGRGHRSGCRLRRAIRVLWRSLDQPKGTES